MISEKKSHATSVNFRAKWEKNLKSICSCTFLFRVSSKLKPLLSLYISLSAMARLVRVARSSSLFGFGNRFYSTSAEASHASSPSPFLHGGGASRVAPKDRNVQWVFLGCPGVGKGTYASRLSTLLGVPHIATGDLVREELASSGPLSQKVRPFFFFPIFCYCDSDGDSLLCSILDPYSLKLNV